MQVVKGDLFDAPSEDALGHGVNCKGAMGAGIARQFKRRFPDMFEQYRRICKQGELRPGGVFTWRDEGTGRIVYNIASQDGYAGVKPARLEWLASGVAQALSEAEKAGVKQLHLPMIGAGLGGLAAEDVLHCLEQVERNRAVEVVVHIL